MIRYRAIVKKKNTKQIYNTSKKYTEGFANFNPILHTWEEGEEYYKRINKNRKKL